MRIAPFYILFFFLHLVEFVSAQGETNIWYFGYNAGLDFNSGSPELLLDGALYTDEGCATISDSAGNLLFYTDGVTVYNRNHQIMPNGTGLLGSFSSTHSAIAIPNPADENKYYLFTVDILNTSDYTSEGLGYSEIDMNLDSGLGDVTSVKNIPLDPVMKEKVIAVLNSDETGYWVVSHRFNSDEFVAFEVTEAGVSENPVVSAAGFDMGYFGQSGQIKISPDGSRLAISGNGEMQIFNFDNQTGVVSNQMVLDEDNNSYGLEFSPNGNLLYLAYVGGVCQYDLTSNDSTLIIDSKVILSTIPNQGYASMQLAPDGKIYVAKTLRYHLDIIHNPNIQGFGCTYEEEGFFLQDRKCMLGLPTFVQSFFNVSFQANNACLGEVVQFSLNNSQSFNSILWNFGDGNTSTDENPVHTYAAVGDYDVTLSVISGSDSSVNNRTITIYELPIVSDTVELKQCDDDLDGFSSFNLLEAIGEISANHINETITFHPSSTDAENGDNPISDTTNYVNQTVSTDMVWARVENEFGCFSTSQINLTVTTTQIPTAFSKNLYSCDDGVSSTDGIASFDLSSINAEIEALFPSGQQLEINYYTTQADGLSEMNAISDLDNYQNASSPYSQTLFVRVDSAIDNDCLGLGEHIQLSVESPPLVNSMQPLEQCDEDGDGIYDFDTSGIETALLNSQTGVDVSYFEESGASLPSPLPNPFSTGSQTVTARLSNTISNITDNSCFTEMQIEFNVQPAAVAHSIPDLYGCDEDGDGVFEFDTSNIENLVLNGQTNMNVSYYDQDGNNLSSPLPNPMTSETQELLVRVESQLGAFFSMRPISILLFPKNQLQMR